MIGSTVSPKLFAICSPAHLCCLFMFATTAMSAESEAEKAVAAIKKLGGIVQQAEGKNGGWDVAFHLRGRELTDDGLAHVSKLNVVVLNLRDTKITSAGLSHLKGMANLRRLHLERTAVDDKGTTHLAGLVNLEYLNLYKTAIGDETLGRLTKLKKLKKLYVWQTRVTDEGVARLQKALPDTKIQRGVDLSKLPRYTPFTAEKFNPKGTLKWIATNDREDAPRSRNGINTRVLFENKSKQRVKIYWVSYGNKLQLYGELGPDETRTQNSYSNNTWLITDDGDIPLGYFIVGGETARAVIPGQL